MASTHAEHVNVACLQEMELDDLLELGVTGALAGVLQDQIEIARSASEVGDHDEDGGGDEDRAEGGAQLEEQNGVSKEGAGVEGVEGVATGILSAVFTKVPGTTAEAAEPHAATATAAAAQEGAPANEAVVGAGLGAEILAGTDASAVELPTQSPFAESKSPREKVDSLRAKYGRVEVSRVGPILSSRRQACNLSRVRACELVC